MRLPLALLLLLGAATAPHLLRVDDREIAWVEAGNPAKTPILFIHGSPGSSGAWRGYLRSPALTRVAHLIAVDRPGFGASEPGQAETSVQTQARLIHEVLQATSGGQRAIVVGHSLGGPVAARLAMDYPEAVCGLLLLAATIDPDFEHPRWYNRLASKRWFAWTLSPEMLASNDEIMPLKGELEAMRPLWPRVDMPTIVLHGTRDGLVPVENADFAERVLVNAEVVRIDGADHFLPWKNAALVDESLAKLLSRCP